MKTNQFVRSFSVLSAGLLTLGLVTGCGGSGSSNRVQPTPPPADIQFAVEVVNLTNAQPLSPLAIVAHGGAYRLFETATAASVGLETLAEGGDGSELLVEADGDSSVFDTVAGTAPIGPGATGRVEITLSESTLAGLRLSVATMLVNTNDGFTAARGLDVSGLAVGESVSVTGVVYDAGTEADSEGPGTIPGPAVGGEGFNAARDDGQDLITLHSGVVSVDDGFAESVLTEQHRFDNPAATIRVIRLL